MKKSKNIYSHKTYLANLNSKKLEIEGIYQISSDIEKKYAFAPIKTLASLTGISDNYFTSVEVITGGVIDKIVLEEAVKNIFTSEVVVLDKKDLNPALYKMLNTENLYHR